MRRSDVELFGRWLEGVRRFKPSTVSQSTPELSHLQFEAMIVAARTSTNPFDFALVAMLGLLGLRVFEACNSTIDDLGEEHGHRVLRVVGKGTKIVLPPAVGRAIDRAVGDRVRGPILLNRNGDRMDRHTATRRLRRLAATNYPRWGRRGSHRARAWMPRRPQIQVAYLRYGIRSRIACTALRDGMV